MYRSIGVTSPSETARQAASHNLSRNKFEFIVDAREPTREGAAFGLLDPGSTSNPDEEFKSLNVHSSTASGLDPGRWESIGGLVLGVGVTGETGETEGGCCCGGGGGGP